MRLNKLKFTLMPHNCKWKVREGARMEGKRKERERFYVNMGHLQNIFKIYQEIRM